MDLELLSTESGSDVLNNFRAKYMTIGRERIGNIFVSQHPALQNHRARTRANSREGKFNKRICHSSGITETLLLPDGCPEAATADSCTLASFISKMPRRSAPTCTYQMRTCPHVIIR